MRKVHKGVLEIVKGKAIYNPSGKAGEYSYWAVNFYNGCSADCEYCYCKKGPLKTVWSNKPSLKKTLIDEKTAMEIFKKEVDKNLESLREFGLFFNFTSDPFLPETIDLNLEAMRFCNEMDIPVKALTKQTWWIGAPLYMPPENVSIGYTLTGVDSVEPGAAENLNRIEAMEFLHSLGYTIFASIEPIIDFHDSLLMIIKSVRFVRHYKIGLLSGYKQKRCEVKHFLSRVNSFIKNTSTATVYWKDSILKEAGIERESLPDCCVNRDYKFWGNK